MKESMRDLITQLSTPEALTASYKETFPGITDAEAEELATLFLQGIREKDTERAMQPLREKLATVRAKYIERELWGDFDLNFPELDPADFPEIEFPTFDIDDL